MQRLVLVTMLALGLLGCNALDPRLKVIEEGSHDMGVYSIDTPIRWGRAKGRPQTWTVDGLETLWHFNEIESGQGIFRRTRNSPIEPFVDGMRPTEIADLFMASFAITYALEAFQWKGLAPSDFGPWDGFSFDFEYETPHGLLMLGMAVGAVIDGKLHLIVYTGTRDYYFDKHKHGAQEIFESIAPS